jgi:hypothetical protein
MARNQRSTSKNTRSEGAAGRGGSAGRSTSSRGGAAGRSGTGRGGAAGRGSKKAADWGGYFGAKNGQGSKGSRSAQGARAAQGTRGQRGAGAGRPGNKKPATDLIEGRRAVAEALTVGIPLKNALVQAASGQKDQEIEALARQLEQEGIPVERVAKPVLDSLSSHGAHQGVIVRTQPFAYADLSEIIQRAGSENALVVVLDHVTDEGNFGAIVRSAEVVGAAGVVIANARAARVGVGAYKTSAGAVLHLPIAQVSNLPRALEELKAAGFWTCGSTEHATQSVWEAPMGGRLALVMGSEGSGISRLMLEKCDFTCKLPQFGQVESLNVAQATTVMCYEWLRRTQEA